MRKREQLLRGPYCMAEVKGTYRYFLFISVEYTIRNDPRTGNRWAIDRDLHEKYEIHERYKAYQETLLSLLSYDEEYDASTPFDILEKARELKRRYFPEWWADAVNRFPESVYPNTRTSPAGDWHKAVKRNALFPEKVGEVELYRFEQWQSSLRTAKKILFLPDNRISFLNDISTWIFPFYETHHITICVKDQESPFTVSESFAKKYFKLSGVELSRIDFIYDTGFSSGIQHTEMIENFNRQGGSIISKGIWNYFSLFRHALSFLFSINNKEEIARGILQKAYSPDQPESLRAIVGYQTHPFPSNVLITGLDFNSLSLEEFLRGEEPKTIPYFLRQRKKDIENIRFLNSSSCKGMSSHQDIQHYSGFFTIPSREGQGWVPWERRHLACINKQIIQVNGPGEDRVYLQGISFNPGDFAMIPVRFDRLTLPETLQIQEPALLSNFSYFFTEKLLKAYNKSVSEEESLEMVNLPFDYMGEQRDGEFVETVPLYRKGYVGSRVDGQLFIGYLLMEEAFIELLGTKVRIPHHAINPGLQDDFTLDDKISSQEQLVCLFTPSYPERHVGKGRYNLVIINDKIVQIGDNQDVTIPPVGVVLSLHSERFKIHLSQINKGESVKWRIRFKEETILQKSSLSWLYGGYHILMLDGENLVETEKKDKQTLEKEGWYLSQSMRTQETQLRGTDRQPRIVLGTTERGRIILLTISGRTRISCGATHTESVLYCQHLLGDRDRLINLANLDGGASAFLEAREAGKRILLNFPAPSDLNPAGVIRPNVAFLKVIRMNNTNN